MGTAHDLAAALTADGLQLTFRAEPGLRFSVQVSIDLRSWSDLGAITVDGDGTASFTAGAISPEPRRIYRLRLQP
jgi:hypothetical protein